MTMTETKKVPRGIRNNNPLNIRKGNNWQGERHPQTDPAFEEFTSMQYGIRAGFKLIRNYMSGFNGLTKKINTIEGIIKRWAPSNENNTRAYIQAVSTWTGIPSRQKLSFQQRNYMVAIVDAMIRVECGQGVDKAIIESAYDML